MIGIALLVLYGFVGIVSAAQTWYVDDDGGADFTKIQDAVNNASSYDTIIVRDGTYTENIDVTVDNVTIRSENGSANCFVDASDQNDRVFSVTTDYVNLSGFTAQNATGKGKAGIYLGPGVDHCNISGNNATNNSYYGILLDASSTNTLTGNTAKSNNNYGILLDSSSTNTLTGNTASNNDFGIYLYNSSTNTLTGNTASNNNEGISLFFSSSNTIYNNNFSNTNNAYDDGNNIWNISKIAGTNVIGGPYLGGNYWSDYTGNDADGDGLGDRLLPYNSAGGIINGGDYHPLVPIVIIPAKVDVDPDTLNLKSKGKWVTTYIELPEGYDVSNIDVNTVLLNDQVHAKDHPTEIGDNDNDGIADLMVKFDRSAVQEILEVGEEVEVTVTGDLTDGPPFEGSDLIRVIGGTVSGTSGTITYTNNGTGIVGVAVNLSQGGSVIASTTTDSTGNYIITGLALGAYTLTASKIRFWSNSTSATVTSGETVTVHRALWLKGDLNNNGIAADAGDLAMMIDASVGKITPDWRYDLNLNGILADAGDQAMLKDASVGKIELV